MHDIEAVYFDFGGTLFSYRDFAQENGRLVSRVAERFGVTSAGEEAIGRAYRRANREAFAHFNEQAYYLHRDLFVDVFRRLAANLEAQVTEADLDFAYACMRDTMIDAMKLRDDCHDVLDALRAHGLCLAIVSNIDDDFLHPMIEKVGLEAKLDHFWSSEQARSCKPDPGFFRYALDRTGHAPEKVLFVGDSPQHDIAGAKPLGMRTALIREGDTKPPGQTEGSPTEAHHEIGSLTELLALVGAR